MKNQETWKKRPDTNPHIVIVFSHTFGQFTLMVAECNRFFAYIRPGYVPISAISIQLPAAKNNELLKWVRPN
ncbi:hypothetical protein R70331_15315 [Paenibacillus sp. FSL R7-0331]|nr:hypothetical protein R70331_15315 [Paenibacillus sp. FSL R7-0331]